MKDLVSLFPNRSWLNQKMKVKLAGTRRLNARIIPSGAGVYVDERKGWSWQHVPNSKTRGRLFVPDFGGRKVAAGFVNPESAGRLPLRSRRSKTATRKDGSSKTYTDVLKAPERAVGPSLAYYFKQLTTVQRIRLINALLQQEFERRVRAALAKG
ncbi:hypothetical protein [Pseudomonas sp. BN515]|uniref:hypothetical protein n=1 Tax=Pseudomonas sp. BN515 TaxID=2567892 RepID=UPI002453FD60|nr:hypothetical protein [Pseudomonas sp. BN515]